MSIIQDVIRKSWFDWGGTALKRLLQVQTSTKGQKGERRNKQKNRRRKEVS